MGTTYYFCAPGCKVAFDKDPDKYVKGEGEHHGMHGMHH
jgi:YHS domain-containing protein